MKIQVVCDCGETHEAKPDNSETKSIFENIFTQLAETHVCAFRPIPRDAGENCSNCGDGPGSPIHDESHWPLTPKTIDHIPFWDEDMFDGAGGFEGEDDTTSYMCDMEYAAIEPWGGFKYFIWSHSELCKPGLETNTE